MFTTITWQDYQAAKDRGTLLLEAVQRYKASRGFINALEANCYFRGENTRVARKTILRARKIEGIDAQGRRRTRAATEDVVGNRIGSGFLFRFVTQQNQFLLSEGVSLPDNAKNRLGADFDRQLERLGERALLHGCAWGYWNADHLEIIEMATNSFSGFFPLLDEMTGEMKLGVQFWQIAAERPMYLRVFDKEGVTVFRRDKDMLYPVTDHQPYRRLHRQDALSDTITQEPGYGRIPSFPSGPTPTA